MAFYVTLFMTSWLAITTLAAFDPGCSFSNGQCLYNVQLGHHSQCDQPSAAVTSGSGECCVGIQGQVSGLIDDVSNLKSQVSELVSSKNNVTAMTDQLSEANAKTQQLLLTLAQKEAELNSTQTELSRVMREAGEELRRLTSELNACKGALGLATNTTTLPDTSTLLQAATLSFCDFEEPENLSGRTCNFTFNPNSQTFGFVLARGKQSVTTGPVADHTFGSPRGHYMLLNAKDIVHSTTSTGTKASIISPEYPPAPGYCIRLRYNMYGGDVRDLNVYIKTNSKNSYPVIHQSGSHHQQWMLAEADLDSEYTSHPFKIEISATTDAHKTYNRHTGNYDYFYADGDVAVDDIFVYSTRCKNVPMYPSNSVSRSSGGQTYYYTFHTQPATWYQAASLCRQDGAKSSLVTVASQEEQDFLVQTIKADAVLSVAGQAGFYMAGNDEMSEHHFQWTDTGNPYKGNYTNWKVGQPNNVAGDQDCLLLQYPELDYQWGDVDCDESHPFICKTVFLAASQEPSTPLIG